MTKFKILGISFILIFLTSCNNFKACVAEKFMQDTISDGVLRLSAQHLSLIVYEISNIEHEKANRIAADHNLNGPKAQRIIKKYDGKDNFGRGKATWKLANAEINYPQEKAVFRDCVGTIGYFQGRLEIIEAKQEFIGQTSHDEKNPIIPDHDKIRIKVKAKAHNLKIRFSDIPEYLEIIEGEISFTAQPRLALSHQGETEGLRVKETSNIFLSNIRLKNLKTVINTPEITMEVPIDDSNFNVQVGQGDNGLENKIWGEITTFGVKRKAPTDGLGLDPKYDKIKFIKTFDCKLFLDGPLSYEVKTIDDKLAQGATALTGLLVGELTKIYEGNTKCGLSSPKQLKKMAIDGEIGNQGEAVLETDKPCKLFFDREITDPDCHGKAFKISGTAIITKAKKTLEGLVTFNEDTFKAQNKKYKKHLNNSKLNEVEKKKSKPEPVIPLHDQPASIEVSITFKNISIKEQCQDYGNDDNEDHCSLDENKMSVGFLVEKGEVDAVINPKLAKMKDSKSPLYGTCSIPAPIAQMELNIKDLLGTVIQDGKKLPVALKGKATITSGQINNQENSLNGTVFIRNKEVVLQNAELDPDYDQEIFHRSFTHCKEVVLASREDTCDPIPALRTNIARLLVLNSGAMLKLTAEKLISFNVLRHAQFSENDTKITMQNENNDPFNADEATQINNLLDTDCIGTKTFVTGIIRNFNIKMERTGELIEHVINIPLYGRLNITNLIRNNWFGFNLVQGIFDGISAWLRGKKEVLIRPTTHQSTKMELRASIANFASKIIDQNKVEPDGFLEITSGRFTIKANPIMGLDERTHNKAGVTPSYSIETPVIKFEEILLTAIEGSLRSNGMTVPFYIRVGTLRAHNGFFRGEGNYIEGDLSIAVGDRAINEIQRINIPRTELNPHYDQDAFNDSYRRQNPNLQSVIPD